MPERQRDVDNTWRSFTIPSLTGGLNTSAQPYEVEDNEFVDGYNVAVRYGRTSVDTGYSKLGSTVRGVPRGVFTHQTAAGVSTILLVTDSTFYKYVPTLDKWHYVSDGVDTTVNANEIAGATMIDVVDTAGFGVGDYVGVTLDDGTQHQTTIVGIPTPGAPGVIEITGALPSAASIGVAFVKALDLTGSDLYQVVFAAVPSHEWTVFTNGVEPPHRYDGVTVEVVPNLPNGGDTVCRTLAMFRDSYLVLGHLVEAGTIRPYKMIWSSAGDPTKWDSGDAGNNSLVDSRDPIIALKPLGISMVVYRSQSIVRMEFVGLPLRTFSFRPVNFGESVEVEGVGAVSPNAVFASPDSHIVLGRNQVYIYNGGDTIRTISDRVFRSLFGVASDLDRSGLSRAFVAYIPQYDEVWVFYPTTTSVFCDRALVFSRQSGVWWKRVLSHAICAAGRRLVGAGEATRIVDLVGTIIEQSWVIGGTGGGTGTTTLLLCGYDTSQVYKYDLVSSDEDGSPIAWELATKLFLWLDRHVRHDAFFIESQGATFDVLYLSPANPTVYRTLGSVPSKSVPGMTRIAKQFVSQRVQFRLKGSTSGVDIRSIAGWVSEESLWSL